jgi:hypothetical protein
MQDQFDTADVVSWSPNAEDPTPVEITDPADPSYVTPDMSATGGLQRDDD